CIAPDPDRVRIGFEHGILLDDDGAGLLEGTGTQMRWIVVSRPADLRRPGIPALVAQAAELAPPPRTKRASRSITAESTKSVPDRRRAVPAGDSACLAGSASGSRRVRGWPAEGAPPLPRSGAPARGPAVHALMAAAVRDHDAAALGARGRVRAGDE